MICRTLEMAFKPCKVSKVQSLYVSASPQNFKVMICRTLEMAFKPCKVSKVQSLHVSASPQNFKLRISWEGAKKHGQTQGLRKDRALSLCYHSQDMHEKCD